ncbi:Putative RfeH [Lichtheimia ramosa]|uniref:Putative RfeH n=1 Tax=Lichtheimia ramosa TaxID=688394 RepID=A0A077W8M3_9FUNG|nr:Putative RfeH [Lichtheimia ramosa]
MDVSDLCMSSDEGSPASDVVMNEQSVQQQRLPSIHNLTGQHPRPATMEQQSFDSSSSSSGNNTLQSLSDTSPAINLTQAISTCTSLCQDIEMMRRDCQDSVILEQIATKANTLLHVLKQDDVKPEYAMIRRARNLQEGVRGSYRRRTKKTTIGQRCHSCHTTETPEWRRGPDGARTLCNACGLHYSKLMRKGSLTVQHSNEIESAASSPRVIQYPNQMGGRMAVCIGQQQDAFINYIADTPH